MPRHHGVFSLATTTRVAEGPDRFAGRPECRGRQGGGTERLNNQLAGIRKKQNTMAGDQEQAVVLLSLAPATVDPSDQSAGQRNCQRRRGGQQNDRTIQ